MNEASKQATLSAIRSILVSLGTLLTANGVVSNETAQFVIGLVMTLGPLLWGAYEGWRKEHKAAAREVVALNAGIAAVNASSANLPLVPPAEAPAVIEQFKETTK